MIISHSRRFIFVHIHKTGGTSMELAVANFLAWDDIILGSSALGEVMNDCQRDRFGLYKHSSIADIERVCGPEICKSYFVFATVRHPLDRMCSLYNFVGTRVHRYAAAHGIAPRELGEHVFSHDAYETAPELAWPASAAFMATPDFSRFIRDERLLEDEAFQTQVSRLRSSVDRAISAKVLRLEAQAEWVVRLKEALGLPFISLPHANKSEATLIAAAQVTSEDRACIEDRFREDYIAFKYPSSP